MTHNLFLMAFVLSVAVISYEDIHTCHRLPWPPRIIFTGLTFALISLFSIINEELAAVIAIGVFLAVFVNKGFVANCEHFTQSVLTAQPTEAEFLVSPTPDNQSTSSQGVTGG